MPGVSAETSSVETGRTPTVPAAPGGAPGESSPGIADRVAYVRLNRPDKRNALSTELLHELQHTAHRLAKDRTLRAVVLAGTGRRSAPAST